MWVFTTQGFVSLVQKPGSESLTVRARDRRSLDALATLAGVGVVETPMADYPYRIVVDRAVLTDWLVAVVGELHYPNFKSAVATSRGWDYAHALTSVWSDMHQVTDLD